MAGLDDLVRCSSAADSCTGEEGPAKKTKTDQKKRMPVMEEVSEEKQRKTKTVMRRVPDDHVKYVLAFKPTPLYRLPPELEARRMSAELRQNSARVQELIKGNRELMRSIQDHYRREVATKGYVEVEVEVNDDDEAD